MGQCQGCQEVQLPSLDRSQGTVDGLAGAGVVGDVASHVKMPVQVPESYPGVQCRRSCVPEETIEDQEEEESDNTWIYRESIPLDQTVLHKLHTEDCLRRVNIIVPVDMREDRTVRFKLFHREWLYHIPEGAARGDTVTVHLPAVPPLDSKKRKHAWENVRHPIRCGSSSHCLSSSEDFLDGDSILIDENLKRQRLDCYRSIQGKSMDSPLCTIAESATLGLPWSTSGAGPSVTIGR
eukprot:gnl/TRDRNA2_/TRDRNA2_168544_c0_seq1.p1 gnl/TRDRNA2_/TRDRNA2_168544_c0~~gnl/TRDRNA2_/TRDRNA2_168544_c0_seq1.p1  ORF type:complete len:237 (+),score=18.67 gnl/TRDRNA2_/TRDRNA2_168544_c0_seq1:49-759(+)